MVYNNLITKWYSIYTLDLRYTIRSSIVTFDEIIKDGIVNMRIYIEGETVNLQLITIEKTQGMSNILSEKESQEPLSKTFIPAVEGSRIIVSLILNVADLLPS